MNNPVNFYGILTLTILSLAALYGIDQIADRRKSKADPRPPSKSDDTKGASR